MKTQAKSRHPVNAGSFITHAAEGLTADGVRFVRSNRQPQFAETKRDILRSLPVSSDVCIQFLQQSGFVQRDVERIERETPLRFHVETEGLQTYVWRVA